MTGDWEQIISSKQRRRVDVSHDSSTVTAIQQDTWMDDKEKTCIWKKEIDEASLDLFTARR